MIGAVSSYCVVGQLPGGCIQLLCGGATSWGLYPVIVWWATSWGLYEVVIQSNYDTECLIMSHGGHMTYLQVPFTCELKGTLKKLTHENVVSLKTDRTERLLLCHTRGNKVEAFLIRSSEELLELTKKREKKAKRKERKQAKVISKVKRCLHVNSTLSLPPSFPFFLSPSLPPSLPHLLTHSFLHSCLPLHSLPSSLPSSLSSQSAVQ